MPNHPNNLISPRFKNKTKPPQSGGLTAEIVVLDDRRPRETWQRLDVVLARLGLLARAVDADVHIVLHLPRQRRPNR
jgi:hypothetical protein